jgi:hypothetical protein
MSKEASSDRAWLDAGPNEIYGWPRGANRLSGGRYFWDSEFA